jgi:putative phosphoesterase
VSRSAPRRLTIGLVSDTHGLLRPGALAALAGVDRIVHAGDIGDATILDRLAAIAPVTAVRGNNDYEPWAAHIPETAVLRAGPLSIYVIHDLHALAIDPAAAGHRVVVAGHSHRPAITDVGGVLYVNPGSAGPRRFKLPIAIARLHVEASAARAEIVELQQ